MNPSTKKFLHFVVALALVGAGILGMGALKAKKGELKKEKPTTPLPVVRIVEIATGPQSVLIRGEGTVRPLREASLVPQVGGKVAYVSPSLVNGGEFREGETLLRIDPVDYELAVTLARARVKDAESKLKMIMEESAAAREEWRIHRAGKSKENREPPPLVAKEPQLMAAQAMLEADKADLKKALLNLDRTVLRAPFNGRVSDKNVGIGQYVILAQKLASLFSTDAVEIVLPLESENLSWFHVPGFTPGEGSGAAARVRARIAGRDLSWEGRVVRTEGKLDERTRMINVVVRVERPYAKRPPLAVGLFVTVEIQGDVLPQAALIPRSALRGKDTVWVVKDGRIRFRKVEVARINGEKVLVKSGLRAGEKVVVTALKVATDNMAVRTASSEEKRP